MSLCGLFRVPGETLFEPLGSFARKNDINFLFPLDFNFSYEKVLYLSDRLKPRDSYYKTDRKMMQPSNSFMYLGNPCCMPPAISLNHLLRHGLPLLMQLLEAE